MSDMSNYLRRENRVPAKHLPKELGTFYVTPSDSEAAKVNAVDASFGGIGFTTDIDPKAFPNGSHLNMYPFGVKDPLKGRVIFKQKVGGTTRVGVQILQSGGYKQYMKKMKDIYEKT